MTGLSAVLVTEGSASPTKAHAKAHRKTRRGNEPRRAGNALGSVGMQASLMAMCFSIDPQKKKGNPYLKGLISSRRR